MKMKGRRRKGYAKNKRKRQLETPKNHSQRFATTVTDLGLIFESFWEPRRNRAQKQDRFLVEVGW